MSIHGVTKFGVVVFVHKSIPWLNSDAFARKQNEWVAKQKAPNARRAIVEE
jgi:hypothetical protein